MTIKDFANYRSEKLSKRIIMHWCKKIIEKSIALSLSRNSTSIINLHRDSEIQPYQWYDRSYYKIYLQIKLKILIEELMIIKFKINWLFGDVDEDFRDLINDL